MKFITFKRGEMTQSLLGIEPVKIMTFSQINCNSSLKGLVDYPMNILMNTKAFEKQKIKPKDWEFKTNNKIHSKLAIGKEGIIIGSWNFSDNSTQNMHELIIVFEKTDSCWDNVWKESNKYFDKMWEDSSV